ncbi:MAG: energy-coupling factor transporter transmembrane protein EcfT [Chloroflexi bacterium]|nr:energy-coupling factor transporter transmembrane protein EcfT [Chloroflexota bacterium]
MSPVYELYQPGRSWLHDADPRLKLAFVLCSSLCLLLTVNLWLILGMLLLLHLILLVSGVGAARVASVWRVTLPTVLLVSVLWTVFNEPVGPAWFEWGALRLGPANLAQGAAIGLRIAALAFTVFVWLYTTDSERLVLGLVALGLPFTWGFTAGMALRYLPTMAGVFRAISEAQQARGLDLHAGGFLKRMRAYIPITVAMVITALRTSQSVSYGLESRALGAMPHRTFLRRLRLRPSDIGGLIALGILAAGYLYARLRLGLGSLPLALFP